MESLFFHPRRPRFFGHRGSATFPENTLPAFQDAVAAGLIYLELDTWCAKDGEVMVHHDHSLARICGVHRLITELRRDEITRFDAGYCYTPNGIDFPMRGRGIRIPTLEEVLATFPHCLFVVEIKQNGEEAVERVCKVIRKTGSAEHVLLASQYDGVLQKVRRTMRELPTSLGAEGVRSFYSWLSGGRQQPYKPPGRALQIPPRHKGRVLVTGKTIQAAHEVGLEMHVWTINDGRQIEDLLRLGVDGIMSDYPHLLRSFLAEKYTTSSS